MLDTALKTQLQAYLQNLRQPIRVIDTLDDRAARYEVYLLY